MKNAKAVFIITLLTSILFWIIAPSLTFRDVILGLPFGDPHSWYEKAVFISNGNGIPDAQRPLFSIILAIFFNLFGDSLALAKIINILFFSGSLTLIYLIAAEVSGSLTGALTVLILLTNKTHLFHIFILQTEIAGLFFFCFSLYCLIYSLRSENKNFLLLSGVFFAFSNLTRTLHLHLFFLFLIPLLFSKKDLKSKYKVTLHFILGLTLPILPWIIRQKKTFNLATISNSFAENLYAASSPKFGTWSSHIFDMPVSVIGTTTAERYNYFLKSAFENIASNPGFYLKNIFQNFWTYLDSFNFLFLKHDLNVITSVVLILIFLIPIFSPPNDAKSKISSLVFALSVYFIGPLSLLFAIITNRSQKLSIISLGILTCGLSLSMFGMNGTGEADLRTQIMYSWLFVILIVHTFLKLSETKNNLYQFQIKKSLKINLFLGLTGFIVLLSGVHLVYKNTIGYRPPLTYSRDLEEPTKIKILDYIFHTSPELNNNLKEFRPNEIVKICDQKSAFFLGYALFDRWIFQIPENFDIDYKNSIFQKRDYSHAALFSEIKNQGRISLIVPGSLPAGDFSSREMIIGGILNCSHGNPVLVGYTFEVVWLSTPNDPLKNIVQVYNDEYRKHVSYLRNDVLKF